MTIPAEFAAALAIVGVLLSLISWFSVTHFLSRPSPPPCRRPPVTILKPLCGAEPLLEEALETCFTQDYPDYQIVFGLHTQDDPALAVVERARARYPGRDVAIVIDPTIYGANRKVSNLINMLPAARHELLCISDSDLHVPANYLDRLVAELEIPGTGLVTSAYIGLPPAEGGWTARLGSTQISHIFLPGVLMSRLLGRADCLGSTALLRRDTLERTGGLRALDSLLAEDNVLGVRVKELGLSVRLADAVVAATVPEPSIRALWQHEIRWTRTIRASAPVALAASTVQYPIFWALAAALLSGGALWSLALIGFTWTIRAASVSGMEVALWPRTPRRAPPTAAWLLPVRDVLSVVEIAASYWIDDVIWRGHRMDANSGIAPAPSVGGAAG